MLDSTRFIPELAPSEGLFPGFRTDPEALRRSPSGTISNGIKVDEGHGYMVQKNTGKARPMRNDFHFGKTKKITHI